MVHAYHPYFEQEAYSLCLIEVVTYLQVKARLRGCLLKQIINRTAKSKSKRISEVLNSLQRLTSSLQKNESNKHH